MQSWRDLKGKARNNRANYTRACRATGNIQHVPSLNGLDTKILSIIDPYLSQEMDITESEFLGTSKN